MLKKGIITQSNYIPWKGYFDSIKNVDVFVVYDDMQYTKRDWRNRNLIKTSSGLKWLSIPVEVKGKYFQKIRDTKVANKTWNIEHWNQIKENYKNSKYYNEISSWLEPLFKECSFEFLTDINLYFISAINNYLKITTEIKFSNDFYLAEEKTERLVNICKELKLNEYYSGPAAKSYMNEDLFKKENIEVKYWDYSNYPEYNQLYGEFVHGVSIIDLLFNEGEKSHTFLKNL